MRLIDIGPFPARWGRVAFGVLVMLVIGGAGLIGMSRRRLECARLDGQPPTCTVRTSPPLPRVEKFPAGSIATAQEVYRPGSKRNYPGSWEVVLVDLRGNQTAVARYAKRDLAIALGGRLRAFLADPGAPAFEHETAPTLAAWATLLLGLAVGIWVAWNELAPAGRLRVEVDRSRGGSFRIRRTLFGIPRGRSVPQRLGRIVDVYAEKGPIRDSLRQRHSPPEMGTRILLVRDDGPAQPLTSIFLRGDEVHARGVDALRAVLGLPAVERARVAPTNLGAEPWLTRAGWIKSRTWVLGGVGVVVVAGLLEAAVVFHANRTQGWVEFHVANRCELDGMEMSPGAEMRIAMDPGRYPFRVFNPLAPGSWETQTFDVSMGRTTTVSCRPR